MFGGNATLPLLNNMLQQFLAGAAYVATASGAVLLRQANGTACPGYSASNVQTTETGLTADLSLAGPACDSYGSDIENLRLTVNYDTGKATSWAFQLALPLTVLQLSDYM